MKTSVSVAMVYIFLAAWTARAEPPAYPTLVLSPQDRILVLSPHPDDDILGCAGVIQSAVQQHLPVQVVYLTNGDNYEWAFWVYKKHPVLSPKGMLTMGATRSQEAAHAEGVLGVPADHLIFLGYPDWGTEPIFTDYWNDSRPPFRSMLTKVTAVPYAQAYQLGAVYRGQSVLSNLEAIMKDFKPTKVFVTHPADGHRDHRAFYLFAQVALWDIADTIKPELYTYLVHYLHWPWPRGLSLDRKLEPPERWADSPWLIHPLTPQATEVKWQALQEHRTQMAKDHLYLAAFVGRNELFQRVTPIRVLPTATEPPAVSTLTAAAPPSEKDSDENEVAWQYVSQEKGNLVFQMTFTSRRGSEKPVNAYVFGYRHDRPFADMPKLHLVIRKNHVDVFNQQQILVDADIQVVREGATFTVRMPLKILGNPERILGSIWSRTGQPPFDWRAWRVLEL